MLKMITTPNSSTRLLKPDSEPENALAKTELSSSVSEDNDLPTGKTDSKLVMSAWKDVIVISAGAFCYNFGYVAFLFNLSTLYSDSVLAFTTLSVICAAQAVASLFLPALLIRRLGCKITAVLAVCSLVPFSSAQFYPGFFTFIPSSIALGIGNTCLWVAVGTYVSNVGLEVAVVQNKRPDVILSTFFGVFNIIRFGGAAAGNLVPFLLLSTSENKESDNSTHNDNIASCGASSCSEPMHQTVPSSDQNFVEIAQQQFTEERTLVFAVFLCVGLLGPILLLLFLDPRRYFDGNADTSKTTIGQLLMATTYAMKDPKHLLLMTTFFNAGILRSFASGDFSKDFVMCSTTLKDVSLAAIISNISYAGGTSFISLVVRAMGMAGALTVVNVLYFLTLLVLLIWTPNIAIPPAVFFLTASGIMGATMGAYNNLNNTSIGLLFPLDKEESYGAYRFHFSLGSLIGYAWAIVICMNVKLWLLIIIAIVAQVTYIVLEYLLSNKTLAVRSI